MPSSPLYAARLKCCGMIRAMVVISASSSNIDEDRSEGKIMSPELRQLLHGEIEVLDQEHAAEHGVVRAHNVVSGVENSYGPALLFDCATCN